MIPGRFQYPLEVPDPGVVNSPTATVPGSPAAGANNPWLSQLQSLLQGQGAGSLASGPWAALAQFFNNPKKYPGKPRYGPSTTKWGQQSKDTTNVPYSSMLFSGSTTPGGTSAPSAVPASAFSSGGGLGFLQRLLG